ncbi:MAG TPA: SMP-30/gluconolactonase/LRE family protein [Steroidobacteraceae bacterium]
MEIKCVAAAAASLGEGPLWDAARDVLWWVDIKSPTLHAHHFTSGANHAQPLPYRLTALGLAVDADLVGVGDAGFVRLSVSAQLRASIAEVIAPLILPHGMRFNDGKVDAAGRFWAGSMEDAQVAARGGLHRLGPQRQVSLVRSEIGVPNGPCFFADGTMLFTDSARGRITALTLDAAGDPVTEQLFAQFSPSQGYPDGMTVDAEDHVWIAFWDGGCLRRLSRAGQIVAEIKLPVQRPTCPAFGGRDLDRLFVTSASAGLSVAQRQQQPLAGGLLALDPGCLGRGPGLFRW